jgi:bacteriocin-like protein
MKDMQNITQVELTDEELQQVEGGSTGGGWANAQAISYGSSGYSSGPNHGATSNNSSSGGGSAGYYGGNGGFAAATGQAMSFGGAATGPSGIGITASGGNSSGGAWSLGW